MENQNLDNSNWDENQKLGSTPGTNSDSASTDGELSQGNFQTDDKPRDSENETGLDDDYEGEVEASDADTDQLFDDEDTSDLDEQIEGSDADEDESVGAASSLDEDSIADEDEDQTML